MDKPVCRLCGGRHYARDPHAFDTAAAAVVRSCEACEAHELTIAGLRARIVELEAMVADPVSSVSSVSSSVSNPVSNPVSRKDYMRDLMRAKRAAAAAAKNGGTQ